jgi:hypothetical protein
LALPACAARIVQVPVATKVTLVPETVHTGVVSEEKLTGNPDDAVALTVNGEAASVRSASAVKLIVCSAGVTTVEVSATSSTKAVKSEPVPMPARVSVWVAGGGDGERWRLVIGVTPWSAAEILAHRHPIHQHLHYLRPELVIAALRRPQAQRVRSGCDVGGLRHLATAVLQQRDLQPFGRWRIAAGEAAAVATDAGAAGKHPARARRRILKAAAQVRHLEAAIAESAGAPRDHL